MAQKFDAIIIGTGQSGPSLAERLVKAGERVAIIERLRFGGTCVNNGCTPTKALVANAKAVQMVRVGQSFGIDIDHFSLDMKRVKKRKDAIVRESSEGVEKWLKSMEGCHVFEGHGEFENAHTVRVKDQLLEGEKIFINVGGRALVPKIPNLEKIPFFTNSSIMHVDFVPEHLLIVGGGYIALEFAQIYRRFGSKVTVLQKHPYLMPKEDPDICEEIRKILEKEGIEILCEAQNLEVLPESKEGNIYLRIDRKGKKQKIQGSHVLIAAGRIPNTHDLGLEKAGIEKDERGFIKVNEQLKTSQPHIWAIGDCNGRGAFTHTSYNDYEIVAENLLDNGSRCVSDRIPIYSLFIDPPLGRIGMTERQAKESGKKVSMGVMPMTRVARAREKSETDGFMKILVDQESKQILGASMLGTGCDEVVQMIATLMYAKAPYTVIQKGVYIHPTVSELIPTLLSDLKAL